MSGSILSATGAAIRAAGRNVRWGITWGLGIATALTLVVSVLAVIRGILLPGVGWQRGFSFFQIIGIYLFGGIVSGALVGLLRPALRWWAGRRLAGMVAGVPLAFGVGMAISGGEWTRYEAETWLITGLIWGFAMSFAPKGWGKEDIQRNVERIEQERKERRERY